MAKKLALVTGANKGIGFETARALAEQGYAVLLGARDAGRGQIAAAKLREGGLDVQAVKLDVTDAADVQAVADLLRAEHGNVLDVLVNNAGMTTDADWSRNTTSLTKVEDLRRTFETNFFAVVALTQALLPALKNAEAARIVNVSSILGSVSYAATKGSPTYGAKVFAYNSSKAALNMFTVHLAHELRGTRIKVNSAHPGWVATDMGGAKAPMSPAEGAKTEVWLATLGEDGPTGGFFHDGEAIPW